MSLIDNLPRLDNEGAVLGFVSANITAVGAGITSPAFTLPQAAVLTDSPLDADAVNDTATWTLGNVVSTGDNVANSTITVTVVARVLNVAANIGLVTGQDINITNTGTLIYQNGAGVTQTLTSTTDINIVEPQVALTKSNSTPTTTVEVGGTVTYTLTLDHTARSTANAYDLTITDVLPTEVGAAVVNYTTFDAAASTCDDGGRTLTDSYTAPTITFSLSLLDLPDTCTIVYTVIVNVNAQEGATYSNLAQVASVTTIPGSDPDERIEPPTPTDSTDFTVGSATIDKVVSATSEPSTGSGSDVDADLTIGEEVTYTVTVTMPDGVRNAVTVRDDLPVAGVQFEFVSATLTGIGGDLSGAGLVLGTAGVLLDQGGAVGVNDRATVEPRNHHQCHRYRRHAACG
ncbi:MAG: hypothetical protein IPK52_27385 [Chloroflexi bacterium]|nr:hypothetical protein [Chloroflexota bacterium]